MRFDGVMYLCNGTQKATQNRENRPQYETVIFRKAQQRKYNGNHLVYQYYLIGHLDKSPRSPGATPLGKATD